MRETEKTVSFCSLRSKIGKQLCVKVLEFKRENSTKEFPIVLFKSRKTDYKFNRLLLAEFDDQ